MILLLAYCLFCTNRMLWSFVSENEPHPDKQEYDHQNFWLFLSFFKFLACICIFVSFTWKRLWTNFWIAQFMKQSLTLTNTKFDLVLFLYIIRQRRSVPYFIAIVRWFLTSHSNALRALVADSSGKELWNISALSQYACNWLKLGICWAKSWIKSKFFIFV